MRRPPRLQGGPSRRNPIFVSNSTTLGLRLFERGLPVSAASTFQNAMLFIVSGGV